MVRPPFTVVRNSFGLNLDFAFVFFAMAEIFAAPLTAGVPRQSQGLYFRSRSKRLFGVADADPVGVSGMMRLLGGADAAPNYMGHLKVAHIIATGSTAPDAHLPLPAS